MAIRNIYINQFETLYEALRPSSRLLGYILCEVCWVRRRMTRQTTAPPFYRNQTSRPVNNRYTITSNMNNKTPPIQPRMNNFTKLENRPLSERTQTKCFKCYRLRHLANQCKNCQHITFKNNQNQQCYLRKITHDTTTITRTTRIVICR